MLKRKVCEYNTDSNSCNITNKSVTEYLLVIPSEWIYLLDDLIMHGQKFHSHLRALDLLDVYRKSSPALHN